MKVAIAQSNYSVGGLEGNKTKIIENIKKAKEGKAELVVFAEYAISGTPCCDLLKFTPFLEDCEEALVEIASACDGITAIVGLPLQHDNQTISVAAVIQDRKVIKYVGKKSVISRSEVFYISQSEGCDYVKVGDKKVAIVLSYDVKEECRYGKYADIVVGINSDLYSRGIIAQRYAFYRSFAFLTGKPIVYVNQLGGQTDMIYDGSSGAYDKDGKAIAFLKNFEEDFQIVDLYDSPELPEPEQFKTANVYKAIKLGIKDYFGKNGFSKACLGMSGGIDSAVVLAMAAEALGPENVVALMLPSQFSSEHSVNDSLDMVKRLGVEYHVVPIEPSFNALSESLKPIIGGTGFDVTEENIQARLRGVMIMAACNKFGYIPLNTSNKSEIAVGYGTLYGDSIGSLSPIGDLYKIEVYSLARYINRKKEVIPANILSKEPSAELRPDQKDSDSLPPYEVLDAILYRFIEEGQYMEELVNAGFDADIVQRVFNMVKRSTHKRYQGCPAIRVSTRGFGNEFIIPITNKYFL